MAHRIIGVPVKGLKLKDGKLEQDVKADMAKLSVTKRIAVRKSTKVKVVKPIRRPT
jgi:hypothetical protein